MKIEVIEKGLSEKSIPGTTEKLKQRGITV